MEIRSPVIVLTIALLTALIIPLAVFQPAYAEPSDRSANGIVNSDDLVSLGFGEVSYAVGDVDQNGQEDRAFISDEIIYLELTNQTAQAEPVSTEPVSTWLTIPDHNAQTDTTLHFENVNGDQWPDLVINNESQAKKVYLNSQTFPYYSSDRVFDYASVKHLQAREDGLEGIVVTYLLIFNPSSVNLGNHTNVQFNFSSDLGPSSYAYEFVNIESIEENTQENLANAALDGSAFFRQTFRIESTESLVKEVIPSGLDDENVNEIDLSAFKDGLVRLKVYQLDDNNNEVADTAKYLLYFKNTAPVSRPINGPSKSNGVSDFNLILDFNAEVEGVDIGDFDAYGATIEDIESTTEEISSNGNTLTFTRATLTLRPALEGGILQNIIRLSYNDNAEIRSIQTPTQVNESVLGSLLVTKNADGQNIVIAEIPVEVPVEVSSGSMGFLSVLIALVLVLMRVRHLAMACLLFVTSQASALELGEKGSYWQNSKWYGSVSFGNTQIEAPRPVNGAPISFDESDTEGQGFAITGGYQWSKYLGLEVTSAQYLTIDFEPRDSLRFTGLSLHGVATQAFWKDRLYVSAKAGMHRLSAKSDGFLDPTGDKKTFSWGANFGVKISQNWDIAVGYDAPSDDLEYTYIRLQNRLRW